MVTVEKVKNELVLHINSNKTNLTQTLKIDVNSIQVTGKTGKIFFPLYKFLTTAGNRNENLHSQPAKRLLLMTMVPSFPIRELTVTAK